MVTTANLIRYWRCNDNAANTTVDEVHTSNNGTASTNTSNLSSSGHGNLGTAFNFNGTSESVDSNYQIADNSTQKAFNMWVKTTTSTAGVRLMGAFDGSDFMNIGELNTIAANRIYFYGGTPTVGIYVTSATLFDGNWHMLTFRQDGALDTDMSIRMDDGALTATQTFTGTLNANALTADLFFGARNNNGTAANFFPGDMQAVSIWSSLSAQDETDLYNAGPGLDYPFITGWANKIFGIVPGKVQGVAVANIIKVQGVA
jgi:hypothetical protein